MKQQFNEASELDGFDDLKEEDQGRVTKAWEAGHVADEDIPETARKAEGDEEEKPKKRAPPKKKAENSTEDKPKRGRPKKVTGSFLPRLDIVLLLLFGRRKTMTKTRTRSPRKSL